MAVHIEVTGAREVATKLGEWHSKIQKVRPTEAIHYVAKEWQDNFRSGGARVGGWQALSEATLRTKQEQGFGGQPILVRAGGLYKAATVFPQGVPDTGGAASYPTAGGIDAIPSWTRTNITIQIGDLQGIMMIDGPAVENQYGSYDPETDLVTPERRFWFVDQGVREAARKGIIVVLGKELT